MLQLQTDSEHQQLYRVFRKSNAMYLLQRRMALQSRITKMKLMDRAYLVLTVSLQLSHSSLLVQLFLNQRLQIREVRRLHFQRISALHSGGHRLLRMSAHSAGMYRLTRLTMKPRRLRLLIHFQLHLLQIKMIRLS